MAGIGEFDRRWQPTEAPSKANCLDKQHRANEERWQCASCFGSRNRRLGASALLGSGRCAERSGIRLQRYRSAFEGVFAVTVGGLWGPKAHRRGQHRRAPDGLWAKNQVRPAASPLPAGSEDQNAVAPNGLEVAYMHGEGCSEYTAGGVVVGPLGGSESVETDLLRRSIDG